MSSRSPLKQSQIRKNNRKPPIYQIRLYTQHKLKPQKQLSSPQQHNASTRKYNITTDNTFPNHQQQPAITQLSPRSPHRLAYERNESINHALSNTKPSQPYKPYYFEDDQLRSNLKQVDQLLDKVHQQNKLQDIIQDLKQSSANDPQNSELVNNFLQEMASITTTAVDDNSSPNNNNKKTFISPDFELSDDFEFTTPSKLYIPGDNETLNRIQEQYGFIGDEQNVQEMAEFIALLENQSFLGGLEQSFPESVLNSIFPKSPKNLTMEDIFDFNDKMKGAGFLEFDNDYDENENTTKSLEFYDQVLKDMKAYNYKHNQPKPIRDPKTGKLLVNRIHQQMMNEIILDYPPMETPEEFLSDEEKQYNQLHALLDRQKRELSELARQQLKNDTIELAEFQRLTEEYDQKEEKLQKWVLTTQVQDLFRHLAKSKSTILGEKMPPLPYPNQPVSRKGTPGFEDV